MTEPRRCPSCGDIDAACCNPECKGQWGTGCHHCHHQSYWREPTDWLAEIEARWAAAESNGADVARLVAEVRRGRETDALFDELSDAAAEVLSCGSGSATTSSLAYARRKTLRAVLERVASHVNAETLREHEAKGGGEG